MRRRGATGLVGWWRWWLELPLTTSTWWWWWLVAEDLLARATRRREILANRVYLDLVDWWRVILRELLLRVWL